MSTKQQLEAALADHTKPTLIEFYADWCPHCQRMMPIVAQLKRQMEGKINIVQIEGDENPDLMRKYGVDSYPTWVIYDDGEEAMRDGGEMTLAELKQMVEKFL